MSCHCASSLWVRHEGGVVVIRATGIDPAVMYALRALVSTQEKWTAAGEAIGNFSEEMSPENERRATMMHARHWN